MIGDGTCDEFEVFGCTDANACNYVSGATNEDESCLYDCLGCTTESACNYDSEALLDDGSCEYLSCIILGCTDELACNYVESASINDGTCTYLGEGECDCLGNVPDAIGVCGGSCPLDENGDGICDVVYGCTIVTACNFNPEATTYDASCDFFSCLVLGCTYETACNFNPEANYNNGSCEFQTCQGCMNVLACDFDPTATIPGLCNDFQSCYGCTDMGAANFDADVSFDDGSCQFPGCTIVGACNYDADANYENGSCDFLSCLIVGCTDENGCNYDPEAQLQGACDYPVPGYTCNGACLIDTDGDGVCDPFEVSGCTDAAAFNFDPSATEEDGSCIAVLEGCLDIAACNYESQANVDDNSCDYESCLGCLLELACNYNPQATQSAPCEWPEIGYDCQGNCTLDLNENDICDPEETQGCMYSNAQNFAPLASFDDGSCIFEGCSSDESDTFSPNANESNDEACMLLPIRGDFNLDGLVQLLDFADFLVALGQSYPGWTLTWLNDACVYGDEIVPSLVGGCTYENAWNYDPSATADLNTCVFLGCTDPMAINYDNLANFDDGSCYFQPCPDLNRDQTIDVQDLLDFFQLWGKSY